MEQRILEQCWMEASEGEQRRDAIWDGDSVCDCDGEDILFVENILAVMVMYGMTMLFGVFDAVATWLILPVVICLSQRLSHASLGISFYTVKLRMAH